MLRDHLRVHGERMTDLENLIHPGGPGGEVEDESCVSELSRKRRRGEVQIGETSSKLARVVDGQAGKVHECEVVGCDKTFKTVSVASLFYNRSFPADVGDSSASLSARIIDRFISASRSTHALVTIAADRTPTNALWIDTSRRTTSPYF